MNPELLTLRRFTAGLIYPPRGIQPVEINRIYADITERYPYQSLQHLPDGARMANPDGDLLIQQTRVQLNDTVAYYQATKDKYVGVMSIIQNHLQIPQFMTFGVKLTAFLQMSQAPQATQFMEEKVLGGLGGRLGILGEGRQGTGLRVVLHRDGIYDVKIEPFFSDLSNLYVELDVQYPEPFSDISITTQRIENAYNYLFGPVRDLLSQY